MISYPIIPIKTLLKQARSFPKRLIELNTLIRQHKQALIIVAMVALVYTQSKSK